MEAKLKIEIKAADGTELSPENIGIVVLPSDVQGEFRIVELKRVGTNGKVIIRRRRTYFRADDPDAK
jgi:hypothetical protein